LHLPDETKLANHRVVATYRHKKTTAKIALHEINPMDCPTSRIVRRSRRVCRWQKRQHRSLGFRLAISSNCRRSTWGRVTSSRWRKPEVGRGGLFEWEERPGPGRAQSLQASGRQTESATGQPGQGDSRNHDDDSALLWPAAQSLPNVPAAARDAYWSPARPRLVRCVRNRHPI